MASKLNLTSTLAILIIFLLHRLFLLIFSLCKIALLVCSILLFVKLIRRSCRVFNPLFPVQFWSELLVAIVRMNYGKTFCVFSQTDACEGTSTSCWTVFHFKQFKSMVELQLGHSIKSIQTNRGRIQTFHPISYQFRHHSQTYLPSYSPSKWCSRKKA